MANPKSSSTDTLPSIPREQVCIVTDRDGSDHMHVGYLEIEVHGEWLTVRERIPVLNSADGSNDPKWKLVKSVGYLQPIKHKKFSDYTEHDFPLQMSRIGS